MRVLEVAPEPGAISESTVELLGQAEELVVWTTEAGVTCVSEARCPHQWSHLAVEGAIDGEELICLTHFWRFDTDGAGWKQNVNGRRDRKGDLEVLPCSVSNREVWVRKGG